MSGGLVLSHDFGRFEMMGEIHATGLDRFHESDVVVNFGVHYQIAEGYALLVSVGRSVYSENTPRATFLSYTGIQFTF